MYAEQIASYLELMAVHLAMNFVSKVNNLDLVSEVSLKLEMSMLGLVAGSYNYFEVVFLRHCDKRLLSWGIYKVEIFTRSKRRDTIAIPWKAGEFFNLCCKKLIAVSVQFFSVLAGILIDRDALVLNITAFAGINETKRLAKLAIP